MPANRQQVVAAVGVFETVGGAEPIFVAQGGHPILSVIVGGEQEALFGVALRQIPVGIIAERTFRTAGGDELLGAVIAVIPFQNPEWRQLGIMLVGLALLLKRQNYPRNAKERQTIEDD